MKIVIREFCDGYHIIVENESNKESFTLFKSKNWDTVKCQRDFFSRLFGVEIFLETK